MCPYMAMIHNAGRSRCVRCTKAYNYAKLNGKPRGIIKANIFKEKFRG
jgi:hypothetical protein